METSYKEKYEKALEKIKNLIDKDHNDINVDDILNVFPELAESEDEMIRKDLIGFFKDEAFLCHKKKQIIAWLKKQGDSPIKWNKNTKDCKPQKNHSVLMKTTNGIAEGEWQGEKWFQYRWSSSIKDSDVLFWIELSDIEKQGETFPVLSNSSNIGKDEQKPADSYCQENCKGFQETGKCFADGECKAKKEAEQKPVIKFKTAEESLGISSDEYNKIVDECLFGEQKLTEFERGLFDMLTDISKPRTADCVKSHSEKLLSIARKMIALEQKPEENKRNLGGISANWSEEDEQYVEDTLALIGFGFSAHTIGEVQEWLHSLQDRVQPQHKQEWSEEDEKIINGLIDSLTRISLNTRTDSTSPNFSFYKEIDWLKSLRPQNRWRPSDEQIECLSDAIEHYNSLGYPAPKLKELMDGLKKLKEGKV